ncbi:metallophosphoesterase family protein [Stigmatella sp. ncwal1]|uniref:Metallophosphoesterase family protein n=1 Tax=Stigmatella ashevillensis TaxID=2995309 RepID=A0ABT5DEJ3_9BACT|nr:metallophosphoesterase family protein [Stigmatella ashevillena]MDC0712043.1 metallophosphoesterase family protein [Stigmatella ashevillena]
MNRIGVIGDIHCEHVSLKAVLRFFDRAGVDRIVSVGDICDGPGDLTRTVELLRGAGVETVAGNHERWLLQGEMRSLPDATEPDSLPPHVQAWLASLPRTRELHTPAGALLVCHGLGEDDMAQVTPEDQGYALEVNEALWALVRARRWRYVINGHSHRRMVRSFEGLTVINAGTLHEGHDPCFGLIDLSRREVAFYDIHDDWIAEPPQVLPLPA